MEIKLKNKKSSKDKRLYYSRRSKTKGHIFKDG